jgi:hypothetical protein
MSAPFGPVARRAVVAVLLMVAGLVLTGAFRVISGTEHQAFSVGAVPPSSVHVTAGKTYQLSVPGGVGALARRGADVGSGVCEWTAPGGASQALQVQAGGAGTKATNTVATFVAPTTGDIQVSCAGWGAMYVDDADNAKPDLAGWFLVAGVLALALGLPLGVSALRDAGRSGAGSRARASEDDEIERIVHSVHVRSEDAEVAGSDGGDVPA